MTTGFSYRETAPRERLMFHVRELERLDALRKEAAEELREGFSKAKDEGYDLTTLKTVLKLRRMTADQRSERRAMEAIYLAALGMLEGEALPEAARRHLDVPPAPNAPEQPADGAAPAEPPAAEPTAPNVPTPAAVAPQKSLEAAKQEGAAAADAGKRVYDNPYPAGDPARAAWDEGWCGQKKSNGMETPEAFRRRSAKPAEKPEAPTAGADEPDHAGNDDDDSEDAGAGEEAR